MERVLRLKFSLGLFENPYVDEPTVEQIVGSSQHVAVSRKLAEEAIVLLKNDNQTLPLERTDRLKLAVIGPNAASQEVGNYTVSNDANSCILAGIRQAVTAGAQVLHEEGCKIPQVGWDGTQTILVETALADELDSIQRAVKAAAQSDVAVLCLGGNTQTSREAFYVNGIKGDRATLNLLGNQLELFRRVKATGTPVVVLYMGGRCYSEPEIAAEADAILNLFYLGQESGPAVANVLFGDVNPSGKLPVTVPRSVGQLPAYYSQKAISFYKDYLDEKAGPLYPFGHGLSYAQFDYGDIVLEKAESALDETVRFSIKITNAGSRTGAEVVQVYFRDLVASVVRPAKQLVRFEKSFLKAGESRVLQFELTAAADLSFSGRTLERICEAGEFELMIGSSSADIRAVARFSLRD